MQSICHQIVRRFLYRVELGTPSQERPELLVLDDYEVATRLSFLLWGRAPDSVLLDAADQGQLLSPDGLAAQVDRLLADPRAAQQVQRFHAMWLGYEELPLAPELAAPMEAETQALVQRVIFDEQLPWPELFSFPETFITPELAGHYGLPPPAAPAWVNYYTWRLTKILVTA